ncbi:MAG TPA: transcriptional regulator [Planctomycetaceae bacterium]|jgi:dTDP-4-amino-4,6-dideoxygalactose transaminase|nr:transcriptional regulator [Rhodopirellula sp.]MCH2361619.1 DegT/DnrJ/EryC1/StrS family aminotransferase [Pirellulales bacterium]HAL14114.1 transcriptional regulator [Planctomycetaceae bacterium]HCK70982.1 transcriptional regulator [Planctomycetaceae bacterium]HCP85987.1 transcriptional regulator [Planctomycetaceae bacterium]|tara:strand:- start:2338 stop:3504 length:1167 start_codon:yes stop_codon:yes gene_type:complete
MTQAPREEVTSVKLLDVPRGNEPIRDEILAAIAKVVDSGSFLFGEDCKQLEETVAKISGAKFGIGCASGSDALLLSLMALGVGEGDEVIVPSFTFFATASAVTRLGAKPVFVDIEADTFNIDIDCVEAAITNHTKAIIPVHLFGQPVDMPRLVALTKKHSINIVEDAAQSIGASIGGKPIGGFGDLGCISFYPTKNLGGFGDGGMIVTNDESLRDDLRMLANHGMRPRYYHHVVGINSRLDSMQAAGLNVKIRHLDEMTSRRQANASLYSELFADRGLGWWIEDPRSAVGDGHVWNQYTVRVKHGQRDALAQHLQQNGMGCAIYYPIALHQQQCFLDLGIGEIELPETERATQEVLSLPIFPELQPQEIEAVVDSMQNFFVSQSRMAA